MPEVSDNLGRDRMDVFFVIFKRCVQQESKLCVLP